MICDPCKHGGDINSAWRKAVKDPTIDPELLEKGLQRADRSHAGCLDENCTCAHLTGDVPIGEKTK